MPYPTWIFLAVLLKIILNTARRQMFVENVDFYEVLTDYWMDNREAGNEGRVEDDVQQWLV